ncbi:MAG: hypothetical protein U1E26_01415 [Coriobacteriia bacterium]|nr:hypothetical protein [Coriobacteriia bacterium]
MGTLYDLCVRAGKELESRYGGDPIGLVRAKGELAAKSGFLVTMVSPNDVDDLQKRERLVIAATQMGIQL